MSIKITYETLFDVLRKESSREDLQELPITFYADAQAFLAEKKAESATQPRAAIEYENTRKIVRELYDRRERKLLLLALNKARTESAIIDPSILLEEERGLFDNLVQQLRENKQAVLTRVTGDAEPAAPVVAVAPTAPLATQATPKPSESATQKLTEPESTTAPETPSLEPVEVKVKFVKPVPKFIGRDMTIFGPFNADDTTELPEEVAAVLAKKGHVEVLNTSS